MVEFQDEKQPASRIQWTDVDVEGGASRPRLSLHRSNSNISINSMHSRRASIDPASALPIQYRTVSFQIAESKEKNAAEIQKAKDSAAKGTSSGAPFHSARSRFTRTFKC
jgi:sodium/potassium-transporting ATPase subunit alpha